MERTYRAAHDHTAAFRQHALMHPAFGALPVPDLAPDVGFADHLDGQALAPIDPLDRELLAGPGAEVHLVGAQGNIALHAGRRIAQRRAREQRKSEQPTGIEEKNARAWHGPML